MHLDHYNYLSNPAQGSTLNAGQFGSANLAPQARACKTRGCTAYDAAAPAHPKKRLRRALANLFRRNPPCR